MKKILLSLIIVFVFAGNGWGTDAWVVWEKHEGTILIDAPWWKMYDAFPTYEQCMEARLPLWQEQKKTYENNEEQGLLNEISGVPGESLTAIIVNGGSLSYEYKCYPDTIDPRDK